MFSGNFQFNEVSPGWFPQVLLVNAVGSPDSQGVLYRVAPDGSSTVVLQFHATVRTALRLYRYPFDDQTLRLVFRVLGFGSDEVALWDRVDRTCRWAFPLTFLVLVGLFVGLTFFVL